MSAKKPVKKTVKMTELSPKDLRATLATKHTDLLGYRRGLAAGELANPRVITATRKDIARLMTALNVPQQSAKGEK